MSLSNSQPLGSIHWRRTFLRRLPKVRHYHMPSEMLASLARHCPSFIFLEFGYFENLKGTWSEKIILRAFSFMEVHQIMRGMDTVDSQKLFPRVEMAKTRGQSLKVKWHSLKEMLSQIGPEIFITDDDVVYAPTAMCNVQLWHNSYNSKLLIQKPGLASVNHLQSPSWWLWKWNVVYHLEFGIEGKDLIGTWAAMF